MFFKSFSKLTRLIIVIEIILIVVMTIRIIGFRPPESIIISGLVGFLLGIIGAHIGYFEDAA